VATPLLFSGPLLKEVWPLKNVTVPVGVSPLAAFTVAVKVRIWPTGILIADAAREVVVAMPVTVTETGGEDCEGSLVVDPL
jgi:hypothetical protein